MNILFSIKVIYPTESSEREGISMAIDSVRQSRTVASISDSSHDAIICSSATEVLLLTGYWPVMAASVAIFSSDGQVKVVVPEDEVELASKTSSAEIVSYKPAELQTLENPLTLLKEPLRSAMKGMSLSRGNIGLQLTHGVQPASYAVSNEFRSSLVLLLQELLPEASFTSCDDLLERMKAVKTVKELEILQTASRVAAAGFGEASTLIEPGMRETDVAAKVQAAFETAREAESLQRSYGYYFCMSGPNSATAAAAYARTRQRVIEEGDLVMIHANTCADGYWTDLTRTYVASEPSGRQRDVREAIDEARAAGMRSIRPGVTGGEVDRAARSVMESHGFGKAFKHAAGHGVGFAAANPNGRPRIHPLSPDLLEAGMTFNLEPAAYFDGYGGMRHCDVIAVTTDGARVMTDF
jgi:Xaa-Pro aminopeptidase